MTDCAERKRKRCDLFAWRIISAMFTTLEDSALLAKSYPLSELRVRADYPIMAPSSKPILSTVTGILADGKLYQLAARHTPLPGLACRCLHRAACRAIAGADSNYHRGAPSLLNDEQHYHVLGRFLWGYQLRNRANHSPVTRSGRRWQRDHRHYFGLATGYSIRLCGQGDRQRRYNENIIDNNWSNPTKRSAESAHILHRRHSH